MTDLTKAVDAEKRIQTTKNTTHTPDGYEICIVSGEGTGTGTAYKYSGAPTARGINRQLNRERCGGDRWAYATIETPERHAMRCEADLIERVINDAIAKAAAR